MKPFHLIAALGLALALGGCASQPKSLQEVRDFAAESAKLGAFSELTARYRDTYRREQAYLSPAADARERLSDAGRHAAYDDFISIQKSVILYMQTLGKLAGDDRYDLSDQIKKVGGGIKAWPDSGLDSRHVTAYANLTSLLARMITAPYQEQAVRLLAGEGDAAVQNLLDAMVVLLRYYDKSNEEERKIVLGLFDIEIPFADTPRDRLLATLAKAHYQSKAAEYSLVKRRYTLVEKNLDAIVQGQRRLAEHLSQLSNQLAITALEQAGRQVRNSRAELDVSTD